MKLRTRLLVAIPLAAAMLSAPMAAQAGWRRGYYGYHPHYFGPGPLIGGALLGLGVGAVVGSALAPPPVYYRPPPVYYAPPPAYYAPPPAYYAPPPAYYPPY